MYKAFNAAGEILYVGVASNWGRRWAQHAERSAFYALVARLEIEWLESRELALQREAALIREHGPQFNRRGRGSTPAPSRAAGAPLLAGVCEACGREPAYSFSWFPDRERWYADRSGRWRITGYCTADDEHYYILFERWVDRAENDWLRHLRGKNWFNESDFREAVARAGHPALGSALRRQLSGRWGE